MPDKELDPLFPALPEDLSKVSDEELATLLAEHEEAAKLIDTDDEGFLLGLSPEEIITQYKAGAEQIKAILAERDGRGEERSQAMAEARAAIKEAFAAEKEETEEPAPDPEPDPEGEEVTEEIEAPVAEPESVEEEPEPVTAAAVEEAPAAKPAPPAATPERQIKVTQREQLSFVASALLPNAPPGSKLETMEEIVKAQSALAKALGRPNKSQFGREERYVVASLDMSPMFPDDWTLDGDWRSNGEKIASHGSPYFGKKGLDAMVAAGNVLCAPLEPLYDSPRLFTDDRPVAGALPSYAVARGGINVPTPTSMGDADGAITVIDQADEELGGTYATKACLDLTCPSFVETAVTTISHCRQYGNLQSMAWPEKIAYENALTMAEWARVAETYLLDRIKALSVNVTSGAETASAISYFADFVMKAKFGMRSRLRLPAETRFVVLAPRVLLDIFQVDSAFTVDGNRFAGRGEIESFLAGLGVDITWYLDGATSDGSIADASQTAAAVDGFPDTIQLAFHVAGTFTRIVMPDLNLGIVRDSTLNSTNEYEIFGEGFENVARIGPAQAAYWETLDVCANGMLAPAGTARTCD